MAGGSLGALVVTLGLDAAEFFTGLTKSEREAAKFAKQLDDAIVTGAKAAGVAIAAMGTAALGAFAAIDNLAKQAGNFKDLEEMTGANAEALASFAVAAGTAGVGVDTVAGAMNKLTKGLVTTEDETKDAGAALAALGIPIKEFKALDPAAQIETVAKALAGFEDGAAKTAVAMALFGKSGAALLPFLKELAAEGGRQVILTQQQIERADAYADAQARSRTQLQLYLQALATEALPTITSVIKVTKEFAAELLGVSSEARKLDGEVIRQFAEKGALALAFLVDAGDGVVRVFQSVGLAIAAGLAARNEALRGNLEGAREIVRQFQKDIGALLDKPLFSSKLKAEFDSAAALRRQAGIEDRGFKPPGKQLSFSGKDDKAGAQKITDAERLIESLEKQLEKTQDLTILEQVELEISKAKFTGLTAERQAAIEALAVRIQDAQIAKKAEEDRLKLEEQAARIREQNSKALTKQVEEERKNAESIRDANEQMEVHIASILGGEDAVRKLTVAKTEQLIKEKELRAAMLSNTEGNEDLVAAINEQIAALKRRNELVGEISLAEKMKEEADKLQDLKNNFSDALVGPLMDFVNQTKSAKDAFRSFLKSIQQMLQEKAARSLADYIFGGKTSSGFDFSTIFKLLGGLFGGGGGLSGAGLDAGTFGPGSGLGFGNYASGTNFHPGGRAWVGENGPELLTLPRGARVLSSDKSRAAMGPHMSFVVNVLPGADTRSARQAGESLRDVVVRSLKDR